MPPPDDSHVLPCPLVPTGAWIRRRNPDAHRCALPRLNDGLRDVLASGDVWRCRTCGTDWTVRSHGGPRPSNARWEFERA